ncbi:muscle M-line assembly protein unc-89-like [Armigeres subalbatus]|uniref:muscle M-line assembly protein unc-89-like n=1 Tax=Armigeres subalbatus TaxID=124917 RepID=UPI002ED64943
MSTRRERRSRRSGKDETPVKIELTPESLAPVQDFLAVPKRGDSPRDFRSLHREKSPFEIGEKPDVQVASQKAIIDKALVMDISGGVTNVDEYISLFFTDSCSLDPASCGDISTVKIEIVEEQPVEPEAPKPAVEHEKTISEAEAELAAKQEEERGKSQEAAPAPVEVVPEPVPEPVEEEVEEEEEEEEEVPPPREPTPPPPPPPREPTPPPPPPPKSPTPEPEYDSDVELIPPKEEFDPSVWKSVDDLETQLKNSEEETKKAKAKEASKESSRRESTQDMTERERDLEWQRQRQLMRPPLIISHLKSRAAPKGSTVRLTCTISGPGIVVRWFKDGNPIEKSAKHSFKVSEGLLSLEVVNVDYIDQGEYSCVIKNKNGETSTSTTVKVYESFETKPIPPTFISIKDELQTSTEPEKPIQDSGPQPEDKPPTLPAEQSAPKDQPEPPTTDTKKDVPEVVPPASEATSTIASDGQEPPSSDEAPQPGFPKFSEKFKKDRPEQSPPPPQYGDDLVKYHHKKILHNRDKLQWSVHLTNRAGLTGRRFKLMCMCIGFQPELKWFKNNEPIEYDDHIVDMNDLHRGAYGCIWINDLCSSDAGTYKCVASNGFEEIETVCKLTVVDPGTKSKECAPSFVPHRTREIFDQYTNILTIEHLIEANPPPTITWIKGLFNLALFPDPHIRMSQHFDEVAEHTIASLIFYDPTFRDSGEYVCTASNKLGDVTNTYNLKFSSEEEYFEFLAKKRPSAKLKRELELGIIVPEDADTFDPDEILARVDAQFEAAMLEQSKAAEGTEDSPQETTETTEDQEEKSSKSSLDKVNIKKPESVKRNISKVSSLPEVSEVPELEEQTVPAVQTKTSPPKNESEIKLEPIVVTSPAAHEEEVLYTRKKTQIELGVEELERRKKFDFVSHMPNVRFPLGKTFRLFSYVKCPGEMTSEWKHDGRILKEGLRSSFITTRNGTCVLEIEKCKYRDGGVYTCVAKSKKYGEIEQSCTVTIYETEIKGEKPVFTKVMKETYNPLKDELYLECTVRGDPTPETIWIIQGTFMHKSTTKYYFRKFDDGRQQLTIFQPKKEDSGRYVCRARNSLDKTDMVYYLNYKNSDEDVIKVFEDELHKKTDKPISSRHLRAKECVYSPEDENLIKWSEARSQHEKEYGYNYKLHFVTRLLDKTVPEGSNLKFTCYVDGKYPQFMWYKDDMPIVQGRKYRQKQRRDGKVTLEVINVNEKDAGVYKIEARNYAGTIESKSVVTVYQNPYIQFVPPIFASTILETYSLHSDEIILECRVRGSPRPNIAWIKDGEYIIPGDKYEQYDHADGTCKLIITKPGEEDSGTYTCEAESGGCSDAISHNVQFVGKEKIMMERTHSYYHRNPNLPHFYQSLADYSIPSGGNICLVVEVQGNCEVQWFKDKYEVKGRPPKFRFYSDGTGVFALCITAATMDASGKYTCRATNAFGKAESSSNVDVINPNAIKGAKPPIFMARPQPEIKIRQGQEISMAFKIIGDPKPKVQWMKGTKDITNAARTVKEVHNEFIRFSIKEALVTDEGAYFIVARNRYGIDRCFTKVTVKHPKGYKKDTDIEETVPVVKKLGKGRV